jgi:Domain of unknown function (DUF4265)
MGHPGVVAGPDNDRAGEHHDLVRVRFRLPQDDGGWPPVASEGLWVVPLGGDLVRLDNVPWFARDVASGDTLRTATDSDGVRWATDKVAWSGNCTVRVIPFPDGALAGSRQAVLDAFAALGVDGEGLEQYGIVALNVPPAADLGAVQRLLRQGVDDGWWDYEEGCIGQAWRSAAPG